MGNFDFEAGKRFREEGDLAEAIRCLKSALEQDRDSIETYIELTVTYIAAFDESGDPLCLDSARHTCMAGLRRECSAEERGVLQRFQDHVEGLLLESQKAEMDAMSDAMDQMAQGPDLLPDDEATARPFDEMMDLRDKGPDDDPGH
ncbi:MAG TPA: hypothetical protein VNI57_15030 [Candidatus Saccharimonadales bacterium]|nr:hypothetical protein [Candidatus Saccharimonadales bacterium]